MKKIEVSALNPIGKITQSDFENLDKEIDKLNDSIELSEELSQIDVADFLMDDFTQEIKIAQQNQKTKSCT